MLFIGGFLIAVNRWLGVLLWDEFDTAVVCLGDTKDVTLFPVE